MEKIKTELEDAGVTYKVDDREGRPGFKYFEWERKGIPLRLEVGSKDIQKESVVVVDRILGKKEFIQNGERTAYIKESLENMQKNLLEKSKNFRTENTREVSDYEEFKKTISEKTGFVFAHLCLDKSCEEKIKEDTKASSRCIPFDGGIGNSGKCIYCNKDAPNKVLFAKAY